MLILMLGSILISTISFQTRGCRPAETTQLRSPNSRGRGFKTRWVQCFFSLLSISQWCILNMVLLRRYQGKTSLIRAAWLGENSFQKMTKNTIVDISSLDVFRTFIQIEKKWMNETKIKTNYWNQSTVTRDVRRFFLFQKVKILFLIPTLLPEGIKICK